MDQKNDTSIRSYSTRALAESALLIAAATVLSLYAVFKLPNGGSITICSMIPIILISTKYSFFWSLTAAFAYSLIQMIFGFYAPPVQNLLNYCLVVLLDYILAFSVLCLAGPIFRWLKKTWTVRVRLLIAAVICFVLRFLCHYTSGVIIWGTYASADQPIWLYSLLYNGSYMLCECLISGIVIFLAGQKLATAFMESDLISRYSRGSTNML